MICKNGDQHTHTTVYESKVCWGIIRPEPIYVPPVVTNWKDRPGSATPKQLNFLKKLGCPKSETYGITCNQASALIDRYKEDAVNVQAASTDPRLDMAKAMFDMVPDGYYAVTNGDNPLKFFRVNTIRTQRGRGLPAGTRKIDTQHSEEWIPRVTVYPDGRWHMRPGFSAEDVLILVADYEDAAYRYGREIGQCARCNKTLTDERSRHYAIGPECEKHWPWMIEKIDLKNDGLTYEQLLAVR